MVLPSFCAGAHAHGAHIAEHDIPRWDAAYTEPAAPMEYQGLGVFRPHGYAADPAAANSDFLFNHARQGKAFAAGGNSPLTGGPDSILALIPGARGWRWAQLPATHEVVTAVSQGQKLDFLGDDSRPPPELLQGDAEQQLLQQLLQQQEMQQQEQQQQQDWATMVRDNALRKDWLLQQHKHDLLQQQDLQQQEDWQNDMQDSALRQANLNYTAPPDRCGAGLERSAPQKNFSHSYTHEGNDGDVSSQEVATRCFGDTCLRATHDMFPKASSITANVEKWTSAQEGTGQEVPWVSSHSSRGNRVGRAVNKAFQDMSLWMSNGLQETCGGRKQGHVQSDRSFSHSYLVSNAGGTPSIEEAQTHCRNGQCFKIQRHINPSDLDQSGPAPAEDEQVAPIAPEETQHSMEQDRSLYQDDSIEEDPAKFLATNRDERSIHQEDSLEDDEVTLDDLRSISAGHHSVQEDQATLNDLRSISAGNSHSERGIYPDITADTKESLDDPASSAQPGENDEAEMSPSHDVLATMS